MSQPIPLYGDHTAERAAHPLHNLSAQPTPLVGRERDLELLRGRLLDPTVRLLTLTGPPGTGKTRLAHAVAAGALDGFADGVWFVPLETVHEREEVAAAVAQALGVRESGTTSLLAGLASHLAERQTLLVLDNFEQVLAAGVDVAELLAACPRLTVLVTSRAALRLRWEHEAPVTPLALPDPAGEQGMAAVGRSPAVQLFLQRAQAVLPEFRLTEENSADVAAICARLDGLPLAIELAAARVKLLPPRTMLGRLKQRLALLTGGASDLPARHRTLRAALSWSYDLLTPTEQAAFCRLGVFAGGCTIEAAEAVASPESVGQDSTLDAGLPTLDLVESLLTKSLLRWEEYPAGEARLRMLESVRELALERLSAGTDAEAAYDRHMAYYAGLAERAEPELQGPAQEAWLARLEAEHGNLRAALDRAVVLGDAETALRLGASLWRFWATRGYLSEGREWLDRALSVSGRAPAAVRAKALNAAGNLAQNQGDHERATALLEQSLELRRELGDERGIAVALNNLALVAVRQEHFTRARALHEECLAIVRNLDDRRRVSMSLGNLALVLHQQGDDAGARSLLEESLVLARELGDTRQVADALGNLGELARRAGDTARARALLAESLTLYQTLGAVRRIAECFEEFAALAAAQGQPHAATRLGGAAQALREQTGAPPEPMEQAAMEATIAAARAALGEEAFAAARAVGAALPLDDAIAEALAVAEAASDQSALMPALPSASAQASPALPDGVTAREAEVLRLIAAGHTNREIAAALVLSGATVERHIANLYAKIGARGRADATTYAIRHGLA